MGGVDVHSSTQKIVVTSRAIEPSPGVTVQRIVVESPSSVIVSSVENRSQVIDAKPNAHVAVINAGPIGSGIPGVQGPEGPPGPQGPQGPSGAAAGSYTHYQNIPSAIWTVVHNLGFYPAVTVVDSAGSMVEGDVQYNDLNTVTLSFSGAFGGIASFS